ncbi:MAG: FIST C-terminal domain-containing protein [Proteobacteria bacterium]|nr:FIST C-terminal domain-containing protein [Pseudomonadota bacterium]
MKVIDLAQLDLDTWNTPKALLIYATQQPDKPVLDAIWQRFPDIKILGMSSSHGIFQASGFSRGAYGLLFEAEDGIVSRSMLIDLTDTDDARSLVAQKLEAWRSERKPAKLFIMPTAGPEERIIEGIRDVFSDDVHIFGGTAGQDKFLDCAYVFLNGAQTSKGLVVTELITGSFFCMVTCGGYLATPRLGTVTDAHGRTIKTINGLPAAQVYNDWTDGRFANYIRRGGDLPRSAGLYPFGRTIASEPECGYWLSHPFRTDARNGAIQTFSEIPEGAEIRLMRATETALIDHIRTAVETCIKNVDANAIAAAMIMYCSGCASIITENMPVVCQEFLKAFGATPFLGCVTLGEQGRLLNAHHNYHGNMMIGINLIMR